MIMAGEEKRGHVAAGMLLVGTLFWGAGFTWAKAAGEALNREAGLGDGSAAGPVLLLVWRFLIGGAIWMAIFPPARRGWSAAGLLHAGVLGALLAVALVLQHLGLDRTTEAVSAFLTSMSILFVPLLMTFALRRPPGAVMWLGVVLATAGVWLMTGAAPAGFGLGEALSLICAVVFSLYIIAVNLIVPRDDPWRLTGGPFLVVGVLTLVTLLFLEGGPAALMPAEQLRLISAPAVWPRLILLTLLPTVVAYGLLVRFQPRVTPTRATLIYMFEPVAAMAYAWIAAGREYAPIVLLGAALILLANILAELLGMRGRP